jgi:hypothetical protein
VVADSHRFDEEERDSHPDLHQSEKSYPDPHQNEMGDPDPQHCLTWWVPQKNFCTFFILIKIEADNMRYLLHDYLHHEEIFPRCLEVWGGEDAMMMACGRAPPASVGGSCKTNA